MPFGGKNIFSYWFSSGSCSHFGNRLKICSMKCEKQNLLGVSIDWFYCRENRMKKTFDWLALEKHSFSAMFLTLFLSKLQYKLNKANQVQRNRRMLRSNSTKLSNQSNQWVYSVTNLIRVRLWSILVSHSSVFSILYMSASLKFFHTFPRKLFFSSAKFAFASVCLHTIVNKNK